jgi:hypothetical protein
MTISVTYGPDEGLVQHQGGTGVDFGASDVSGRFVGVFSGTHSTLVDGTPAFLSGANITLVTQPNGALKIYGLGAGSSIFTTSGGEAYTPFSVAFGDVQYPSHFGSDVFFYVSGSTADKTVFQGPVVVSSSVTSPALSGSLTQLAGGGSYLIAGGGVQITTGSSGAVTISSKRPIGVFSDTTVQSASLANTAYYITYDTVELDQGVYRQSNSSGSLSRLVVPEDGIYELQFSPQVHSPGGTKTTISFWVEKNRESGGGPVVRSNSMVDLGGSINTCFPFLALFLPLSASDYVELGWSADATGVHLNAVGPQTNPTRPADPSIIVNVKKINPL